MVDGGWSIAWSGGFCTVGSMKSIFHLLSTITYLGLFQCVAFGQGQDSSSFNPSRFWTGVAGFAAADVVTMVGLNSLWYSGHDRTSFHWHGGRRWDDDWNTYVQQDKLGHAIVAYHLARVIGEYGLWSGLSRKQAGVFGGAVSAVFQSQIELFDGFSEEYGASRTDILANIVGGAAGAAKVAYPERLSWFALKYSYHPSPYYDDDISGAAPLRFLGNALKDYDGISYWFVVKPSELEFPGAWPKWLGVSLGYSGSGLAHPVSGLDEFGGPGGPVHRRQVFIAPDLDLTNLREKWPQPFRGIAGFFSFLRLPAPALQLTPEVRWFWVYY